MTQEDINFIFNVTILIYEDPWFKKKKRTRDEVQAWVAEKLAERGVYTISMGMSWGHIVSEERYNEHHNKDGAENN
jgi:hypothetical protein